MPRFAYISLPYAYNSYRARVKSGGGKGQFSGICNCLLILSLKSSYKELILHYGNAYFIKTITYGLDWIGYGYNILKK